MRDCVVRHRHASTILRASAGPDRQQLDPRQTTEMDYAYLVGSSDDDDDGSTKSNNPSQC